MKKKLFIFADFDGVFANICTWGNDTQMAKKYPSIKDLDMNKINFVDKICRRLDKNVTVFFVSISSWKEHFNEHLKEVKKLAGIKRMKLLVDEEAPKRRLTEHEPWIRLKLIKYYLDKYSPDDYIILDDEFVRQYTTEKHVGHLITTDQYDGLNYNTLVLLRHKIEQMGLQKEIMEQEKQRQELIAFLAGSAV